MFKGESVLAVVPARGGSKGILRKNLSKVGPHSLIGWSGIVARSLTWLDAAILSTDDEEIAAEGQRYGLSVPFIRPAEFATDAASGVENWRHAWLESEKKLGMTFSASILLQPTTPLRLPSEVEQVLDAMLSGEHLAATSVSRVPGHFVPEKILRRDDCGRLSYYRPDGASFSNRQSAPCYWSRNGLAYAARREYVIDRGIVLGEDCFGVMFERPVPNIDEPADLEFANLIHETERWPDKLKSKQFNQTFVESLYAQLD